MKTSILRTRRITHLFIAFLLAGLMPSPASAVDNGNGSAAGGTSVTIDGIHFVDVSVGDSFSLGVTNKGTVYAWGDNTNGELGNGSLDPSLNPVQVLTSIGTPLTGITKVAAGANFALALTSSGTVYSWGLNDFGQLGLGNLDTTTFATLIPNMADIVAIDANGSSAYALTGTLGEVFAWGDNTYGQLGNAATGAENSPVRVMDENNEFFLNSITSLSAGSNSAYAIGIGGQLWSWGWNNRKQLGDLSTSTRTIPVRAQLSSLDFVNVVSVSGGDKFALAKTADGAIYSWGYNVNGSTGLGPTQLTGNSNITKINSLSGISRIYTAAATAFALKSDGSFYSWGLGTSQTLGDNGATRSVPALVTPSVPLASLTDGTSTMLGLDANGNIYGWGTNANGEVGDGTATVRPTPTLSANFLPTGITFGGTAGTDFVTSGTQWTCSSPVGTENTTVALVGQANLRTASTTTTAVTFNAGTFSYDAAPVVTPTPDPTTPAPNPAPTQTTSAPNPVPTESTPAVNPTPDPVVETPIVETPVAKTPVTSTTTQTTARLVAPVHEVHPAVSGKATVAHSVTATVGTWTGYPTPKTTIQWYRCGKKVADGLLALPNQAKCNAINKATHAKYTLNQSDKGKYLVALIKGKNSAGTQTVTSASTKKVK